MATFTSWGKWEEVRVMIKQALLDNKITLKENELDKLLLTDVLTAMIADGNEFIKNNIHRWQTEKKQLILDSDSTCLGSIVKFLTERFDLSTTQKQLYLMPAIEKAHQITNMLIDSILLIGGFTLKIKNELLIETYGPDFAKNYPELLPGVYVYDPELSLKIQSRVIEETTKIAANNTPDNQNRLKLHAIHMREIIQQKEPDPNFDALFEQKTGQSMSDYKDEICQSRQAPSLNLNQ